MGVDYTPEQLKELKVKTKQRLEGIETEKVNEHTPNKISQLNQELQILNQLVKGGRRKYRSRRKSRRKTRKVRVLGLRIPWL